MYANLLETKEDSEVFRKLYEKNRQKLYRIAEKIIPDGESAEDVVQVCFLKLGESFGKYRHETFERLERLCHAIVVNAALDVSRAYHRKAAFLDELNKEKEILVDYVPDVLDEIIERNDHELVVQAVKELKEEERYLLYLRYGLELKPREIGTLLDMTSMVVRRKLLGCRTKLARIMEDEKYEYLG